jgi:phthalate 4,5-dioxygenase oxygenase subunit
MGSPDHQAWASRYEFDFGAAGRTSTYPNASAILQLAAGARGRHRFQPRLLAAPRRATLKRDPLMTGSRGNQYNMGDLAPHFEIADHPAGLFIGVRRNAEPGTYYWRITPWCMPAFIP